MAARIDFAPARGLRNRHVQSILASSRLRNLLRPRGLRDLERGAQGVVLDCGRDVRLAGVHNAQRVAPAARGLAVLLHGWEGSVCSTYMLQTGARLLREGWDVFRLNFRDHGDTHALNRGIFHSCRIDEVVGAVRTIAQRWPQRPLVIAGYSLGGNFALRVALRAPDAGIPLDCAIAVCPVIDPHAALFALEHAPRLYHAYFMHKWRRSLERKQRIFPDTELFTRAELHGTLRSLTEALVLRHTDFGSLHNYLDGYSVAGERLAALRVPTSILTARDDPVIPVADFAHLQLPPNVELDIAEHGGHCGFIRDWSLTSDAEDYIVARLARIAPAPVRSNPGVHADFVIP